MDSLMGYGSSDEDLNQSDSPVDEVTAQKKRNIESDNTSSSDIQPKKARLALPETIQSMFSSSNNDGKVNEESDEHDGRKRSFAHERGNWASYVYIKFDDPEDMMSELVQSLIGCVKSCDFKPMDDLHISLSRTFVLRHHWIEPLLESLRINLKSCRKCATDMDHVRLYTNDEKTRTFMSIELGVNKEFLKDYVRAADHSLKEFKLPVYYKDPSFHMSVAWALGDVTSKINDTKIQELDEILDDFMDTSPKLSVININQLHLKAGNKMFTLPLG